MADKIPEFYAGLENVSIEQAQQRIQSSETTRDEKSDATKQCTDYPQGSPGDFSNDQRNDQRADGLPGKVK